MADIISIRITSSHYESHYVMEEITFFFFFPGDTASAAQPSDAIGLVSFSSFSHFVTLGRGAPSIRVLEDGYKTSVMLRFTEEKCVLWASLTSTTARGEFVSPFIHLFIALNL